MRESALRQTLQARVTRDTKRIQSSDWPKWRCTLWRNVNRCLSDITSFQMVNQTDCRYVNSWLKWKPSCFPVFNDVITIRRTHHFRLTHRCPICRGSSENQLSSNRTRCYLATYNNYRLLIVHLPRGCVLKNALFRHLSVSNVNTWSWWKPEKIRIGSVCDCF